MIYNPNLIFEDEMGNIIDEFNFEPIKRGNSSKTYVLKIKNIGDPCQNILIKPITTDPLVSINDSINSTYLSLNQKDYGTFLNITLDKDEIITFYVKWQPPFNAALKEINWGLVAMVNMQQEIEEMC